MSMRVIEYREDENSYILEKISQWMTPPDKD
jgi:hypothetical protein